MSDKTLVERLVEAKPANCADFAKMFGIECQEQPDCVTCKRIVCCSIANAIEGEYIPRPRYEDGEPVQFGDIYTDKYGREWKNGIKSIRIDCNGDFSLHNNTMGNVGRYEVFGQNKCVKRHKPDSLERIEDDATMPPRKYVADRRHDVGLMDDEECICWMCTDLLHRQRKLLENK